MYNDVLSIRITSLYGSTPSSVAFECKTATFGPELQVSMGPRPHLWFCACKTVCLAPELLVSLGPSPHLWLLHVKQRLLDQNDKSLWVPDMTCRFVNVQRRSKRQNNQSLWVPALIYVFWMHNSDFGTEKQVSIGPRHEMSFCACKTA